MIPVVLSITFGIGVFLLYTGLTTPPSRPNHPSRRIIERFLSRAGLRGVRPREFAFVMTATSLVTGLTAQLLLGWPAVSVLVAGIGGLFPIAYTLRRYDRRRAIVQTALVQAIGQLRDAIRSGLSMQEALVSLARSGPEALRPEFTQLARDLRLSGLEAAVSAMREQLADPVFDVAAATLLLNDRLGGRNVSQVLDRLANATRAELRVQQELRAYQARTVLSARIIAAVPLVLLFVIRLLNPGYLDLFSTAGGQLLMSACVVSVVLGYASMLWLTRLPSEPRVLVP
jgi:tight adherence protein B